MSAISKYFKFAELGTNYRRETLAGFTTFISMAYILFVNSSVLGAAKMNTGAVFTESTLFLLTPYVLGWELVGKPL